MTARLLNVSEDEYRADPSPVPSLSQSIAKILITRSPAHAWLEHPKNPNRVKRETTDALERGALIDHLLLGGGAKFVVLDYEEYRTKEARAARDDAYASGKIPVKRLAYEAAEQAVLSLRANMARFGIDLTERGIGGTKYSIEWYEGPTVCRGQLDHVYIDEANGTASIIDIKTTDNASPERLGRTVHNFSYDVQGAAYTRALAALMPELEGKISMTFLFCELDPPYAVVPAKLDGAFRELGERKWLWAVRRWEQCLRENSWPGYITEGTALVSPPVWALAQGETLE